MSSRFTTWSVAALPCLVLALASAARGEDCPGLSEEFNVSNGVEAGNYAYDARGEWAAYGTPGGLIYAFNLRTKTRYLVQQPSGSYGSNCQIDDGIVVWRCYLPNGTRALVGYNVLGTGEPVVLADAYLVVPGVAREAYVGDLSADLLAWYTCYGSTDFNMHLGRIALGEGGQPYLESWQTIDDRAGEQWGGLVSGDKVYYVSSPAQWDVSNIDLWVYDATLDLKQPLLAQSGVGESIGGVDGNLLLISYIPPYGTSLRPLYIYDASTTPPTFVAYVGRTDAAASAGWVFCNGRVLFCDYDQGGTLVLHDARSGAKCQVYSGQPQAQFPMLADDHALYALPSSMWREPFAWVGKELGPACPTPEITYLDGEPLLAPVGTEVSFQATISAGGRPVTYTWDFGDGTLPSSDHDVGPTFGATHTYSAAGIYTVTFGIVDECDQPAGNDIVVVVYDPLAGFTTGGGWFIPDAESTIDGTPVTDGLSRANFGFVVRYKKDSPEPTGNLEFVYKAGSINLKSSGMDWLVVTSESKVRFKGLATINGTGLYTFKVTAEDNGEPGTADTFKIEIWLGVVDTENAAQPPKHVAQGALGGGNIQVNH